MIDREVSAIGFCSCGSKEPTLALHNDDRHQAGMLSGTTVSMDAPKGKSILGHDSTHDAGYMWLWGHHVHSTSQGQRRGDSKAC